MSKKRYYDRRGGEVTERHALDRNGILKNGCTMRVPTTMRDAALITDGHGDGGLSLRRPGYRIATNDDRRQAVADAYAKADKRASQQWKCHDKETLCDDCDGEGYDEDGTVCDTCGGSGVVENEGQSSDRRTVTTKDQAYQDYDRDLANAWRSR